MTNTVLITGCSSGLGRSTALFFAKRNWHVIATMRRPEIASDLKSFANMLVTQLDVEDLESVRSAIDTGIARFGSIDALVNNAGYGLSGIFEATPIEKVREQFAVNLFGVMNTTRAILPHFRSKKSGVIVNISSGSGVFAVPATSLYCASKFALEGFSESLSYELASQGIRMKLVEPGGIYSTEFFKRSTHESAANYSLPDYDNFIFQVEMFFAQLDSQLGGTEDDVSTCIYNAITDGTDQLRYVATRDIQFLIDSRRGTSEEEYMSMMRAKFESAKLEAT